MRPVLALLSWISFLLGLLLNTQCTTQPRIICLVPCTGITQSQTRLVKKAVVELYQLPVIVVSTKKLPDEALCPVRHRYRAQAILDFLADHIPTQHDAQVKQLALSTADIEIETPPQKPHWGVLGLANEIGGDQCVASTFRLRGRSDRLVKVSLHEIGHTLNLTHCKSNTPACLMNDARGKVATVDEEQLFLCNQCKSKLQW